MPGRSWGGCRDEGATAVEYAVMTALVAVMIMMGVSALGANLQTVFAGVDSALDGEVVEPLPSAPPPSPTPIDPVEVAEDADEDDAAGPPVRGTRRGPGNNNAGGQGNGHGQGLGQGQGGS